MTKTQSQLAAAEARADLAQREAQAAQALAGLDRTLAAQQAEEIAALQANVEFLTAERDRSRAELTAANAKVSTLEGAAKTLEVRMVEQITKLGISAEDIPATGDPSRAFGAGTRTQELSGKARLASHIKTQLENRNFLQQ